MLRSARFQTALRRSYASTPASSPNVSAYVEKAQKGAQGALAAAQKAAGPTGDKVAKHASCQCPAFLCSGAGWPSFAQPTGRESQPSPGRSAG